MNSDQRRSYKAGLRASQTVSDAIARSDVRAEEVGGEEYLAIIGTDAWVLAQEVKALRQRNAHLVDTYNALLRTMELRKEITAPVRNMYANLKAI